MVTAQSSDAKCLAELAEIVRDIANALDTDTRRRYGM